MDERNRRSNPTLRPTVFLPRSSGEHGSVERADTPRRQLVLVSARYLRDGGSRALYVFIVKRDQIIRERIDTAEQAQKSVHGYPHEIQYAPRIVVPAITRADPELPDSRGGHNVDPQSPFRQRSRNCQSAKLFNERYTIWLWDKFSKEFPVTEASGLMRNVIKRD
jgi:hypothetical protein